MSLSTAISPAPHKKLLYISYNRVCAGLCAAAHKVMIYCFVDPGGWLCLYHLRPISRKQESTADDRVGNRALSKKHAVIRPVCCGSLSAKKVPVARLFPIAHAGVFLRFPHSCIP